MADQEGFRAGLVVTLDVFAEDRTAGLTKGEQLLARLRELVAADAELSALHPEVEFTDLTATGQG